MRYLSILLFCGVLHGQTCTVASSGGTSFSGYSGITLTATVSGGGVPAYAEFTVDAYNAQNFGIDAPTSAGRAYFPLGGTVATYPFNTFYSGSGAHTVGAKVYDATNALIATCPGVSMTFPNIWPISWAPSMTVTPSTAFTSPWSTNVTMTNSISGSGAGTDSFTCIPYVSGIPTYLALYNAPIPCSSTFTASTKNFPNGTYNICMVMTDTTGGTTAPGGRYNGYGSDPCQQVTFNNSSAAIGTTTDVGRLYLAPAGTHTLTALQLNADGTTTSGNSPFFYSTNPAAATVNVSTGLVTGIALGSTYINAVVPQTVGTDLTVDASTNTEVTSALHPFAAVSQVGWSLYIPPGGACTSGFYVVTAPASATKPILNASPGAPGTNCGNFQFGPSATVWTAVSPVNHTPCFGRNGAIYSSADNASCFVMHALNGNGNSLVLLNGDQPYVPGAQADFSTFRQRTFEYGAMQGNSITGSTPSSSCSAFHAEVQTAVSAVTSAFTGLSGGTVFLSYGGIFGNAGPELYTATYGGLSGAGCTPNGPIWQDIMTQWGATGFAVAGSTFSGADESRLSYTPLAGPIGFSTTSPLSQNWLNGATIVCNGTTCTVNAQNPGTGVAYGSFAFGNGEFAITGATTSGLNSVHPSVYTATRIGGTSNFTFPSTVAAGTYSVATDPNLVIQSLMNGWYGPSSDQILPYDAFSIIATQQNAVGAPGARPAVATYNQGASIGGGCNVYPGWAGNTSTYTQSIGSVTSVADYAGIHVENGVNDFLQSRPSINSHLWNGWAWWTFQNLFGCGWDFTHPLIYGNAHTGSGGYWGDGYGISANVCSASGNTITLCSPLAAANPIPGMSRIAITGGTDAGGAVNTINQPFYIDSINGATLTVSLAATDFTTGQFGGFGGTANFNGGTGTNPLTLGSTYGVNFGVQATGTSFPCPGDSVGGAFLCGDQIESAVIDATQSRNRGNTFTFSGVKIQLATAPGPFNITSGTNTLSVVVNGSSQNVTLPTGGSVSNTTIANAINTAAIPGFTAGTYSTQVLLYATETSGIATLVIGNGSANAPLALTNGTSAGLPTGGCLISAQCNLGRTFYLRPENLQLVTPASTQLFYSEEPILSATGGTATVIFDNNYVKGRNFSDNQEGGPAWYFVDEKSGEYAGDSGARAYQYVVYASGYSNQLGFTGNRGRSTTPQVPGQFYGNQHFENGIAKTSFFAHEMADKEQDWTQQFEDVKLNPPDCGRIGVYGQVPAPFTGWGANGYPIPLSKSMECAAWSSSKGIVFKVLNLIDGPNSYTVTTTPYLTAGQKFVCYASDWKSIGAATTVAAGTGSYTFTFAKGGDQGTCIFPTAFNTIQQPALSASLSDVSGATDIVVQWGYDPYMMGAYFDAFDCGAGGICSPGWIKSIGAVSYPISYRLVYRNSGGRILATSAIQTQ